MIHWLFTKNQYRPESGTTPRTFLNRVIRHKLADLIKYEKRNKRKLSHMSESLDEADEEGQSGHLKERSLMVENRVIEEISIEDLPAALDRAMANLSFRQKQLCRLLSEGMSQVEAGAKMNIPRTTLQEEIKRIRDVFRAEGLEEYLRS